MTLKELEAALIAARATGAGDATTVYLNHKKWTYMKHLATVEFQKREGWPEKEWPLVLSAKA